MPWKITFSLLMLFSLASDCIPAGAPAQARVNIVPPVVESKIGYLSFSEDTGIKPDLKRIFIAPQTRLPVMLDSSEFYLFLVRIDTCSVCCMVPKYQKFMVLMEPSKDKTTMYFRGGIEADLVPFTVLAGEELPVTGSDEKNYFATVRRQGVFATLKIPKDSAGLSFSKESAFSKFAAEQGKKGLVYYNGGWVTSAQAQSLRNSQDGTEKKKQERWSTLKAQAEAGVVVLKDGRILYGSYKGCDKVSILFETDSATSQYGVDDVADISLEKALSMANLNSAGILLAKARDLAPGYPGQAKRNIEQLQLLLRKVNPSVTELMEKSMNLGAQAAKLDKEIDSTLNEKNLAIYNYEVFPKEVLAYHLKNSHMLLAGGTWIMQDQLCKRCSGNGKIACAKCEATGKVALKCIKCQAGRIACHICEGSGFKTCGICNGAGQFIRTCTYCGGSGVVSGYYSYPCGTRVFLSSGAVMVVGGYSPWFYPCYTAKTCPVCDGTGNMKVACTYCGGYGKMVCPKTEKCSLCNGAGFTKAMCPDCEGNGRITCPDCKGKGFLGQAQKYPEPDTKTPSEPASGAGKSPTRMP